MRDGPTPLRRIMALRQFPLFAGVELGELAMIADNLVATTLAPGSLLADHPGLHLVLDGRIEEPRGGHVWGAFDAFGLLHVLAHRTAPTAITATDVSTFRITASDVDELLEDNFSLLRAVLRELAGQLVEGGAHRASTPATVLPAGPLTLVERLILLRRHVAFTRGPLQALAQVAQVAEEVHYPAARVLTTSGDLADESLFVLAGVVRGSERELGPGTAIGTLEALGGLRHTRTLTAATPIRALRCSASAFLDVLEDHTDFALAMVARFASALLDGNYNVLRTTSQALDVQ